MENITHNVKQLVLKIRSLKARNPFGEEFNDPLIEQILNSAIDIKTAGSYPDECKKPLSEITGLEADNLPETAQLNKSEKTLLGRELLTLLQHYHLFPEFPDKFPDHLKYNFLKELWKNRYPLVTQGACYIELCDYDVTNCPFTGYCSICDVMEFERIDLAEVELATIKPYCLGISDISALPSAEEQNLLLKVHYLREKLLKGENLQKFIVQKFHPVAEVLAYPDKISTKETQNETTLLYINYWEGNIIKTARIYCLFALKWLNHHENYFEAKKVIWELKGCMKRICYSLSKQMQYCIFIYSTIIKAKVYLDSELSFVWGDQNKIEKLQRDKDMFAKLALVAIDMSIYRWESLMKCLPEFRVRIEDFIDLLKELRRQTEEIFPDARGLLF